MSVSEGDHYKNTSGATLFGFFPPDAVCVVRQTDPEDEDTGHAGTLVLELVADDDSGVGRAAGLTEDDLDRDWEPVKAPARKKG